ncbi:MAG: leucine-rich repeat domain-containing protein, partial [Candidatus Hodarchaeota archaeon]
QTQTSNLTVHQGIKLNVKEVQVLHALEKQLKNPFPILKKDTLAYDDFGFIAKDNYVNALGLYQQGLTTLPEIVCNLTKLQVLNLYNNHLSSLPNLIGNLQDLQVLNLWKNHLSSLPETIGNLIKLENLSLRNNKFLIFPKIITRLINLRHLELQGNQ